jgi:preprotein translocase subunit YajC
MSSASYSMSMVQAAPANEPSGVTYFLVQSFPFLAIFVIFYLLWIRPQARRAKEHRATIDAVKKGDEVITAGGIRGRVTKVTEEEAEVEIASGVRVRVIKATLTQVLSPNANPAND